MVDGFVDSFFAFPLGPKSCKMKTAPKYELQSSPWFLFVGIGIGFPRKPPPPLLLLHPSVHPFLLPSESTTDCHGLFTGTAENRELENGRPSMCIV